MEYSFKCPCANGCRCDNRGVKYDWQLLRGPSYARHQFIPINADAYPPEERSAILEARKENV